MSHLKTETHDLPPALSLDEAQMESLDHLFEHHLPTNSPYHEPSVDTLEEGKESRVSLESEPTNVRLGKRKTKNPISSSFETFSDNESEPEDFLERGKSVRRRKT